ncbi:MAG TPA: hypothetical protein P5340_10630 [Defluviicoccus sp.]|nr:hypothetical protein [Defluviicoccus sp.]
MVDPKVSMIMSLIVDRFACDGGIAQNLATQIFNANPQMSNAQITNLLARQFNVTGAGVLLLSDETSKDIENVLNA